MIKGIVREESLKGVWIGKEETERKRTKTKIQNAKIAYFRNKSSVRARLFLEVASSDIHSAYKAQPPYMYVGFTLNQEVYLGWYL